MVTRSVSSATSASSSTPASLPEKVATNARLATRITLLESQIASLQQNQEHILAALASLNQAIAEHNHTIGAEVAQQISEVAAKAAVIHMNEHLQTLLTMGTTLLEKQ